jgi:hypothetical protein
MHAYDDSSNKLRRLFVPSTSVGFDQHSQARKHLPLDALCGSSSSGRGGRGSGGSDGGGDGGGDGGPWAEAHGVQASSG